MKTKAFLMPFIVLLASSLMMVPAQAKDFTAQVAGLTSEVLPFSCKSTGRGYMQVAGMGDLEKFRGKATFEFFRQGEYILTNFMIIDGTGATIGQPIESLSWGSDEKRGVLEFTHGVAEYGVMCNVKVIYNRGSGEYHGLVKAQGTIGIVGIEFSYTGRITEMVFYE
jgi:hypothetical protein